MEVKVGEAWDYRDSPYIPPAVQQGFEERMRLVDLLIKEHRREGEALCDIGCNAGHLLERVRDPKWGYDIAEGPLDIARLHGLDARTLDITGEEPMELAPIVTICEVLEHLTDPHALVRQLNTDPVRVVIASGPAEETEEFHYEQHCWAWDLEGFAKLFEDAGFTVVAQTTAHIFQALAAIRG